MKKSFPRALHTKNFCVSLYKNGGIVMAWVAKDYIGEWIFNCKPDMWAGDCIEHNYWLPQDRYGAYGFQLPQGSIKKLIGRELSFSDEPVKLK
jgi:hypothetical protein